VVADAAEAVDDDAPDDMAIDDYPLASAHPLHTDRPAAAAQQRPAHTHTHTHTAPASRRVSVWVGRLSR
jgi:hypothetical protein